MQAAKRVTPEFREQATRFVFESMKPSESLKRPCVRLAPRLELNAMTLYNWSKQARPAASASNNVGSSGSDTDLRAENVRLRQS